MPTRYLKPGIRDSARIEAVTTPDAEILYYRLLISVDDFGRMDSRPLVVKSACFPIRSRATAYRCEQWLQCLERAALLMLYEVDGKRYLQLTKWDNKPRAQQSKCPDPITDAYKRMQPHTNAPVTVTVTETDNRNRISAQSANALHAGDPVNGAVAIPLANKTEWHIPKPFLTELEAAYPDVDAIPTLREIRAWCISNPTKCKTERGVQRFINRWFEKEQNHG